jgi:hypothetical protein
MVGVGPRAQARGEVRAGRSGAVVKPRRTHRSNKVYSLPGGTEDNDLWVEVAKERDVNWPVIRSTWEPSEEERQAIAAGANIELSVSGGAMPPVSLNVTTVALGKPPGPDGAAGE